MSALITAVDLAAELASEDPPAVLDASLVLHSPDFDGDYRKDNGRPHWLEAHIPGSQHVDVATEFSDPASPWHYAHPSPDAIAARLAALGIAEGRRVVIYDTTATMWAARLWYLLTWIGVDARVLDGGLGVWRAAGLPVEAGESAPPAPVPAWGAAPRRDAWIERDEVAARSADDARPLVCALPASSFDGSAPTRYSRRGRIPGSVNVSSRNLFAEDGTFVGSDALRAAFASAGIDGTEPEVQLYCGGGISASVDALALHELGIRAVRIYDGSLEEWSADPDLPLEVG
ncbi:MAG: sulfurtransferase [Microbacteriaceae bacterium]|nr:sulfurtransferase [Microbacteriaceae bacterium]